MHREISQDGGVERQQAHCLSQTHQNYNDLQNTWCWRRYLKIPWTARRSNQSVLMEIIPEYSLEGLMLKLQYFGPPDVKSSSLEKTLMLGKTEGRRRRGWQKKRWLESITDSMDMNFSKLQEMVEDREAWHAAVHGVTKSQTWLSNWMTTTAMRSHEVNEIIIFECN